MWYGGYSQGFYPSGTNSDPSQTIQMVGNICLNKRLKVTLKTDIEKEEAYNLTIVRLLTYIATVFPTAQNFACRIQVVSYILVVMQVITIRIYTILCLTDTILKRFHLGVVITIELIEVYEYRRLINSF